MMNKNETIPLDPQDEPIVETLDFSNPSYKFVPKEVHDWRQKGYFLECKSCEIIHATFIGSKKILVGLDEKGQPILKNRF